MLKHIAAIGVSVCMLAGCAVQQLTSTVVAGTMSKGTLMHGADLPVKQSSTNPMPLLIKLADGEVPGHRGCYLVAAGVADDLSTRAHVRGETISCEGSNGVASMPVKGFLVGADGYVGVKGTLIQRQDFGESGGKPGLFLQVETGSPVTFVFM